MSNRIVAKFFMLCYYPSHTCDMTEESTILYKSKSFVLGYCNCGCKTDIRIRGKNGYIQRYFGRHRMLGKHPPNYKDGRRRVSGGYISILKRDHHFATKKGYVLEHRLVYEQHYKCSLLPWAIVHHINGIKDDNRIENLEIMNQSIHMFNHVNKHDEIIKRVCNRCGSNKTHSEIGITGYICYKWTRDPDDNDKWICRICYLRIYHRLYKTRGITKLDAWN